MRGRSVLKESSCPNLCAFCAHRLGQARAPSHVQRRFLQQSRPNSTPPAEAFARKEDSDDRSLQSSLGQNGSTQTSGFGTWGLGSKVQSPLGAWGQFAPVRNPVSSKTSGEGGARDSGAALPELLPHEKRAREVLLLQEQKDKERPMLNRHFGAGPASTRGGRPQPTGWHQRDERILLAKAARARELARENEYQMRLRREQVVAGTAGPIIRRMGGPAAHVIDDGSRPLPREATRDKPVKDGEARFSIPNFSSKRGAVPAIRRERERDPLNRWDAQSRDSDPPTWNNLRRNGEKPSEEQAFIQARSDREEQAKGATYSPLWSGSQGSEQRYQRQGLPSNREHYGYNRHSNLRNADLPPTQNQLRIREQRKEEEVQATTQTQTIDINDAEQFGFVAPASKREKEKKSRSSYEPEPASRGKGKGKDKVKRRQHFMSTEEAEDEAAEGLARAEQKRLRKAERAAKKAAAPTPILLPEYISVSNLAVALKVKYEDFVARLHELGYEETSRDHILNSENAGLIAGEYNFEAIIDRSESEDLKARDLAPNPSILPPRPPVVTIMGHVDHGKTTLLDFLRKSSVAAGEHGGITQHIGAFSVPMPGGKTITFLDTPGHAAFLSMRQRGANVTDIVILVVAADDSVKPQTIEAINHAKSANVPMIVAINKIDKGDSNVERVKQDLGRHGVEIEDFGGDTQVVLVSGKTGQGMEELEEAAVTLSEILDMRAETDGPAEGWVLEASIKSMGKVATVLVRRGTMRVGDFIIAGQTWARIRCLRNEAGVEIEEAGPGTPVEIDGWREQPLAGDEVLQAPDEAKAKSVIEYRLEREERDKMAEDMEAVNQTRKAEQDRREREKADAAAKLAAAETGEAEAPDFASGTVEGPKQVYFIVKGDVSGSVEAVVDSLSVLGNKEVQPNIIRSGVGQLSEFDIEHASAAKGYLINFNTSVEPHIAQLAEKAKVSIIDHNIIYRLVDDVKAKLSEYLPPLVTQRVLGEAEIAQIFEITIKGRKTKNIAGCKVRNGTITKSERVRVMRDGEKVFDGRLESLKNVKKEVSEMKKGTECGMGFLEWFDFQVGDQIQSYEQIEEKRYL